MPCGQRDADLMGRRQFGRLLELIGHANGVPQQQANESASDLVPPRSGDEIIAIGRRGARPDLAGHLGLLTHPK